MNIIDLFSGCGGLTEGFRNSIFNIISHVEMDKHACLSLKTREAFYYLKENNQLQVYNDYLKGLITRKELYDRIPNSVLSKVINTEISEETIDYVFNSIDEIRGTKNITGIIGGPPCQAYSTIGRARNKSKKEQDERIYLYEFYGKFLKKYQPEFFLFENVKGLLSFRDQNNNLLYPKVLSYFEDLGYSIEYKIIDSSEYGVSQKRERLFVYGEYTSATNDKNFFNLLSRHKEVPISVNDLFSDMPSLTDGETNNNYLKIRTDHNIFNYYRKYKLKLSLNESRSHNSKDKLIYKIVSEGKTKGIQVKYTDLPPHLQTHKNKNSFLDRFKAIDGNSYSHTVVAHISKDGHYYIHPDINQNRSISVREAARIQGFSDDYYFESTRTSAFKQIGNAVPPILSNKLSNAIIEKRS